MNDDRQITAFSIFVPLNSEVIGPIFTKLLHDAEAYCFGMPEQTKSKDGQFRPLQKSPKVNQLP